MSKIAIIFDHRGRTKRGRTGPVEVRMWVDGKAYYINTGIKVLRQELKYETIVDRFDSHELNERLEIIVRKIQEEINVCLSSGKAIDVADIRRRVTSPDVSGSSREVLDWIGERIMLFKGTLGDGTIKHYVTLLRRLSEYGAIRRWQDVTVDNILRWDAWLHKLTKPQTRAQVLAKIKPEPLSDGAVYNYHKNLKKLLRLAKKAKLIADNPYDDLRGEFKRGEKENVEYLTEDEMEAIMTLELQRGSHLDMVRDLFVMQMFTGMAYADLMKFDIKDYKEVKGKWVTNADRVKSGVAFVAHLLPPVVEVLEKYDMQVPRVTNQVYNRSLKKIGEMSGISTKLHTHLARHTFGTFMLNNKVEISNLQRMMGHKDIKQTLRYAKTLAESVHDEFDMIAEKMKKSSR